MNTITLTDTHRIGGISSLDSAATRRQLSAAVRELEDAAAERKARKQQLQEAFEDALSEGDVRAAALFSPRRWPDAQVRSAVRAPSVAEVMGDALDGDGLMTRAMELLVHAALGMPVQKEAAALLKAAGERWADNEADTQ